MRFAMLFLYSSFLFAFQVVKPQKFYFRSIGWSVSIADDRFSIEDSAKLYPNSIKPGNAQPPKNDSIVYDEQYPQTPNTNNYARQEPTPHSYPQKTLLRVSERGGWRLNMSWLVATIQPIDKRQARDRRLQTVRTDLRSALENPLLPRPTIDSSISQETINRKIFDKTTYKAIYPTRTQYIVIYSRSVNGYDFNCALSYADSDTAKGTALIGILRKSTFEK